MSGASSSLARAAGNGAAMALFVTTLFHTRTQVHQLHLGTKSYAAHKALNEYYDEIVELVDSVAEAYQGKYDLLTFEDVKCKTVQKDNQVNFFKGVSTFVAEHRKELPQDSELQNMVDEIAGLIDGTLYKLRFLS
jgi:hypothetical protein